MYLLWASIDFWHATSKCFQGVIRITIQAKGNQTLVNIDGRVAESDLKEIRRVRKSIAGEVILNLRGLDGCEADGIRMLRSWLEAGAKLQDATPFLEMILGNAHLTRLAKIGGADENGGHHSNKKIKP